MVKLFKEVRIFLRISLVIEFTLILGSMPVYSTKGAIIFEGKSAPSELIRSLFVFFEKSESSLASSVCSSSAGFRSIESDRSLIL